MKTLQKVAQAIWALNEDTDCHDYDQLTHHAKARADDWARGAVEALRDPPDEILAVIGPPYGDSVDRAIGFGARRDAWNRMLDAILAGAS